MVRSVPIACVVAGLLLLVEPADVRACTPDPSVSAIHPSPGEILPANAAIVLRGSYPYVDAFSVTIDGAVAQVEDVPALSADLVNAMESMLALKVVPEPAPGQLVELSYCPFEDICWPPFQFVVGPPDDEPPASPEAAWFDLVQWESEWGLGTCEPGYVTFEYFVGASGEQDEGSPIFYVVEGTPVAPNGTTLRWVVAVGEDARFMLNPFFPGIMQPASDYCFVITTIDAAGNEAEIAREVCVPCHHLSDEPLPEFNPFWWIPPEPAWTDADLVAGGDCVGTPLGIDGGQDTGSDGEDTGPNDDEDTGAVVDDDTAGRSEDDDAMPSSSDGGSAPPNDDPAATTSSTSTTTITTSDDPSDPAHGSDGSGLGQDIADRGCACASAPTQAPVALLMSIVLVRTRRRTAA